MAAEGRPPDDVVCEAEAIAAGWWWQVWDGLAPDRLVLVIHALQRSCASAAAHHARQWFRLHQAGQPGAAHEAARRAQALDGAQRVLRIYA